ncbi:hypothetical protein PVAG01_04482 [Phlyctema vagabunda]|uniref:TauD/TfdA-like domain-containing protein n=1 Tax=Phlyctema vagabunda TaxID=108571 RepID=A0ABR4PPI5_9HELO
MGSVQNQEAVFFEPFEVPGARIVHGVTFPYGLRVTGPNASETPIDLLAAKLRSLSESGEIKALLERHGAIVVSGLGSPSKQAFSDLVTAVEEGRGSHPHIQIGLAGKRNPVAKNIWTANEGSPDRRFYQHNEYSRYTRFPANIHFYCEKQAEKGGETPIAHSVEVYEHVLAEIPELVASVRKHGLGMKMFFPAPGKQTGDNGFDWAGEHSFGQEIDPDDDFTTRKTKAEKQIRKLTDDFHWTEDGGLELTQHIPGLRRVPSSGRPTWFNGLVGRYGMTRDAGAVNPPYIGTDGMTYLPCVYSDGTPIPTAYLESLVEVINKLEVPLRVDEGDLLLVDNFQVSHGRWPWVGERKVLVSMWDGAEAVKAF